MCAATKESPYITDAAIEERTCTTLVDPSASSIAMGRQVACSDSDAVFSKHIWVALYAPHA
jgi:hypothetical protein